MARLSRLSIVCWMISYALLNAAMLTRKPRPRVSSKLTERTLGTSAMMVMFCTAAYHLKVSSLKREVKCPNKNIALCFKHITLCTATHKPSINVALQDTNFPWKRREVEFKIWMLVFQYGKQECWIAMQAYHTIHRRTHTHECRMYVNEAHWIWNMDVDLWMQNVKL